MKRYLLPFLFMLGLALHNLGCGTACGTDVENPNCVAAPNPGSTASDDVTTGGSTSSGSTTETGSAIGSDSGGNAGTATAGGSGPNEEGDDDNAVGSATDSEIGGGRTATVPDYKND